MIPSLQLPTTPESVGLTLAAFVRKHLPALSWSQIRRRIQTRHVYLNGELCLDPARRLKAGDVIEVRERAAPTPRQEEAVKVRYLDRHLVVVEKPAGISTVRHPAERQWTERRKALSPTMEDIVSRLIAERERPPSPSRSRGVRPRLRVVQRLDKETSGLIVFARTVEAERGLGKQFHKHTVIRKYLALVPGQVKVRTITTRLVRDRGDGRRGSTNVPGIGKEAITHIEVVERLPGHTLVGCRLETGRTHQIRIHLAELGHPVRGEKVYNRQSGGEPTPDDTTRLALHAAELGFVHPITGKVMHWTMPLPPDLEQLVQQIRARDVKSPGPSTH